VGGHLEVDPGSGVRRVGITRVHLEEDTGKSTHLGGGGRIHDAEGALIDFNRSGIPLLEVVTEPDIRSPEEARAYAQELRAIVLALGISDARLEEGSLRFDANVSLRPEGADELGIKVEVKNMNSLRSLQRALAFEIERQTALLDKGEAIAQETRHWDEEAGRTEPGRSKEESSDYRYFPEPDLVPIQTNPEAVDRIRGALPELPALRRARHIALGVEPAAAATMASAGLAAMFDDAVSAGADPRAAANWVTGEITAHLNRTGDDPSDLVMDGRGLAELVGMIGGGELSSTAAKEVLIGVLAGEGSPREVAAAKDLMQISDESAIVSEVDAVIEAHPDEVARMKDGEERLAGFLVGQVMKATGGRADPRLVDRLIRERVGL
jgi:aspartyl-tRNA(Asn)/glutamyl-tRNA(Gln) amidotransferase subunit B